MLRGHLHAVDGPPQGAPPLERAVQQGVYDPPSTLPIDQEPDYEVTRRSCLRGGDGGRGRRLREEEAHPLGRERTVLAIDAADSKSPKQHERDPKGAPALSPKRFG